MKPVVKRILKLIIGWFFLILGLVGVLLPIMPGVIFFPIGLAILSTESETAKKILTWFKRRYPQTYARFTLLKRKFLKRFTHKTNSHDERQDC